MKHGSKSTFHSNQKETEMNENQNTAHQIVGEGTSKPVLRGKFIALNTYLRKDQAS